MSKIANVDSRIERTRPSMFRQTRASPQPIAKRCGGGELAASRRHHA